MHRSPRTAGAALLLSLCAVSSPAPLFAQQQPPPPPPRDLPRTVYVPIEEFDRIFDRERGGVFVPYHELLELLRRAEGPQAGPPKVEPESRPPTDHVLVGARLRGTAGERVVQFEATFDVEVLEPKEWVVVPIGLGEASLSEVLIGPPQPGSSSRGPDRAVVAPMAELAARVAAADRAAGRPARSLPTSGYGLMLRGAGRVVTTARFAIPIQSRPGESSFALTLPGAALANFDLALPQSGLKVDVKNALAVESQPVEAADQTHVRAYFGAGQAAQVTWNPRPKQVEGDVREPLLFADTETSLRIDEGVLQATARIRYRILQAPCGEFRVRFPKGYTLLAVEGENMSAYPSPEDGADGQTITIRLHEKAQASYALELRLERILGEETGAIPFPRVETLGTEREAGVLAARTSEFLTLEPAALAGVSQIDAGELPATLARDLGWGRGQARPPLTFRYLRQPYGVDLRTTRILPEVDGKVMTLALVRDDEVALQTLVRYTVRKRGIFGVRLRLPRGFTVVRCGDERTVKDYRVEPASDADKAQGLGDVLAVDFVNQVQPGPEFELLLLGHIRNEAVPEGQDEGALELPRVGLLDVQKETGVLAVGGQRHLKVSLARSSQVLQPVALRELPTLGFPHGVQAQDEEMTFGFRYGKPDGVAAAFAVRKREPKVNARVEMLVDAQEDLVGVRSTIHYDVQYAGVEQVRVQVPVALASEKDLKIESPDGVVKDRRVEVQGEHAVWTVALQGKRTGAFRIELRYDLKLDDLAAGQQREVTIHEVKVLDCFNETGDIALRKHENLVITEAAMDMVERRDKRELPDALRREDPIQAYRYVTHPYRLGLHVIKYDFQAPLGTVIEHLHQDEVLGPDGLLEVEAFLSLRNASAQFLTVLLPGKAEMRGLKVDGRSKAWSVGEQVEGRQAIQVNLADLRRDAPVQLRLRFKVGLEALGSGGRVELETLRFPLGEGEEVPVALLTRELYLSPEYAYLEFDTDATRHFDETSLWADLKEALGVRTAAERFDPAQGAYAAQRAIAELRSMTPGGEEGGTYPALKVPEDQTPYLFKKLSSPARLSVRYMAWGGFYVLDVLVLLAVVGLGLAVDRRRLVPSAGFVAVAAAGSLLGAAFGGKALEPFFASGFVGALGLGSFFLGRGLWRELTVERHKRRLEELAQEAQAARARAQAAEAEAKVPARAAAPASATVSVSPAAPAKQAGIGPEDRAAADAILPPAEAPAASPPPAADGAAGEQK